MAEKKSKTAKKAAPKVEKAAKAEKPRREKESREDFVTFALRLPKTESAALHEAAGNRRASSVMRSLAAAFATGDEAAFRAVVKEAREARQ